MPANRAQPRYGRNDSEECVHGFSNDRSREKSLGNANRWSLAVSSRCAQVTGRAHNTFFEGTGRSGRPAGQDAKGNMPPFSTLRRSQPTAAADPLVPSPASCLARLFYRYNASSSFILRRRTVPPAALDTVPTHTLETHGAHVLFSKACLDDCCGCFRSRRVCSRFFVVDAQRAPRIPNHLRQCRAVLSASGRQRRSAG